jgi:hypothetical protein
LTVVSNGTKRPLGSMVGAANSGWTQRHGEFESLLKYYGLGLTAQEPGRGMSASMRLNWRPIEA